MANFINNGDHNWTGAVWGNVDVASTLTTVTSNSNISTSMQYSSTFACDGANSIDGIALYCRRVTNTGTVTVALNNSVSNVASVTVNASDLPPSSGSLCWVFFKFSSPVTVSSSSVWRIGISGSSNANATFYYYNTPTTNWVHLLRVTTQGTPASGDSVYILGEMAGTGSITPRTVTMNNTSSVGTRDITQVYLHYLGRLVGETSPSTNYHLGCGAFPYPVCSGFIGVGSDVSPLPATSTFTIETFSGTNATSYNSVFAFYGNPINTHFALLAADANAGASSFTLDRVTNWNSGDAIAIASTSTTASAFDRLLLSAAATGTTITTTTTASNAHLGTSPKQAEVINLTRNIKFISNNLNSSVGTLIQPYGTTSGVFVNCQFLCSAFSASAGQFYFNAGTSGFISGCSFDTITGTSNGCIAIGGTSVELPILNNVFYRSYGGQINYSAASKVQVSGCVGMYVAGVQAPSVILNTSPPTGSFLIDSRFSGGQNGGIGFTYAAFSAYTFTNLIASGLVVHSVANGYCYNSGIQNNSGGGQGSTTYGVTLSNCTGWCSSFGGFGPASDNAFVGLTLNNCVAFSNTSVNFGHTGIGGTCLDWTLNSCTGYAGTSPATPLGFGSSSSNGTITAKLNSCVWGSPSTHSTADIKMVGSYGKIIAKNNKFFSTTHLAYSNGAYYSDKSYIVSDNHNQVANSVCGVYYNGTVCSDTAIYKTASPSYRLTPNSNSSSTAKLETNRMQIPILSGNTSPVSVWIRTSYASSGDSATYNGNPPRLIQKARPDMGINSDIVLATAVTSLGAWQKLSGTTTAMNQNTVAEVVVDCDGTAGWVNVDDWSLNT